ncbi:MAG: hypothetical protein WC148_03505 [Bacilli bacterium]
MTQYKLVKDGGVIDVENKRTIPEDVHNRHWCQYLEWCSCGNVAEPASTPEAELITSIWETFEQEANAPATTTDPAGTWKGGESSAMAIRGAALLAEDNGLTTAVITDVNREEHELTIAEVKKVSSAILFQWQAAFFKRQAALREIGQ